LLGWNHEYPEDVRAHVTFENGYVRCEWAVLSRVLPRVRQFAYRLARQVGCLAIENGRTVEYPPEAVRLQAELWERLMGRPGYAAERERQALASAEEAFTTGKQLGLRLG
jgi:hypothetical protein